MVHGEGDCAISCSCGWLCTWGDLFIAPNTALLNRSNWSMSSVFNTLEDAKDLRVKCLQLQHDGLLKVGGCLAVDIETHGA